MIEEIKKRLETAEPPMVETQMSDKCFQCGGSGNYKEKGWCGVCSGQGYVRRKSVAPEFRQAQDDIRWLIAEVERLQPKAATIDICSESELGKHNWESDALDQSVCSRCGAKS